MRLDDNRKRMERNFWGQSCWLHGSGWLRLNLSYTEWDIQVHLMSELLQKLNVVCSSCRRDVRKQMSIAKFSSWDSTSWSASKRKSQRRVKISNCIGSFEISDIMRTAATRGKVWRKILLRPWRIESIRYLKLSAVKKWALDDKQTG